MLAPGTPIHEEGNEDGWLAAWWGGVGAEDPQVRDIHADGLGSIVAMTDANGNVTSRRQYDAWGNLEVGADQPGYAFTGREWDPETQLYYYRARYYDPKVGRFISEDPIGLAGGLNMYAYALGNPVAYSDPMGLTVYSQIIVTSPLRVNRTSHGKTSGAETWGRSYYIGTACSCRSRGHYGFDVEVFATLGQEFVDAPSVPSYESPWLTLGGHEDLHLQDFIRGFSPAALNGSLRTEGFDSPDACSSAAANFEAAFAEYAAEMYLQSTVKRDFAERMGFVWPVLK